MYETQTKLKVIFSCIKCHITTTMGLFNKLDIELNFDYLRDQYLENDENYMDIILPEGTKEFMYNFTDYIINEGDISDDAICRAFDEWVETEITKYDGYVEIVCDPDEEESYLENHFKIKRDEQAEKRQVFRSIMGRRLGCKVEDLNLTDEQVDTYMAKVAEGMLSSSS